MQKNMEVSEKVRVFNAFTELAESMVNHAVCSYPLKTEAALQEIKPNDHIHKRYFFILLLEMILVVNREMVPSKEQDENLLTLVRRAAEKPILGSSDEASRNIVEKATEMLEWLNSVFDYELYSNNLGVHVSIKITRQKALYLVGNRCKHALTRSNVILRKLVKIYQAAGVDTSNGRQSLILEDIDMWLLDDFCGYHFTKICELISNLYYSVTKAFEPVARKAMVRDSESIYSYKVPEELRTDEEVSEFYQLLNRTHSTFVPQIRTWEFLQGRY